MCVCVTLLFRLCLLALAKIGSNELNETQIKGRIFNSMNRYEAHTVQFAQIRMSVSHTMCGFFAVAFPLFDSFTCSRQFNSYIERRIDIYTSNAARLTAFTPYLLTKFHTKIIRLFI